MYKTKSSQFGRRDFLKTALLLPVSALLAACTRVFDLNITPKTNIIHSPPTNTNHKPAEIAMPTKQSTEFTTTPEFRCPDTNPPIIRDISVVDFAVIHHSAGTNAENLEKLIDEAGRIEDQHRTEKTWAEEFKTAGEYSYNYISYHWLIASDGSILKVQDPKYVRVHAHNDNINCRSIAICIIGDFRSKEEKIRDGITDNDRLDKINLPSEGQKKSAAKIIQNWKSEHGVRLAVISHREARYDKNLYISCPGKNIGDSASPSSNLSRIASLARLPIFQSQ